MSTIGRRDFIVGLGGAAAWPLAARAQGRNVRQIGVLLGWSQADPKFRTDFEAFVHELVRFGWVEGSNVHIEQRWTNAELARIAPLAKELVSLKPDVIVCSTTPVTAALQRETATIPIVFAVVADPVGAGFVASLSHPGGNITGFSNVEERLIGKWLDLLKQMVPRFKQAGFMLNPDTAPGGEKYFGSFEVAARSLRIEPIILRVRSDAEIDASIRLLGREEGGLVAMTDSFLGGRRKIRIDAALRYGVPAITDIAEFAKEGGLIAYGPTNTDMFRRAARHVDLILRGAKPADLPVELPTEFKMVINVKTANALSIAVPNALLVSADEVIE